MVYTVEVVDCDEHDGCQLHVGLDDGRRLWESHAPESIPAEVRLNIDHPEATDRRGSRPRKVRYRVPTVAEAAALRVPPDVHRVAATYAAVVGASTLADAAAAAGLSEQALIDEALGWAAAL